MAHVGKLVIAGPLLGGGFLHGAFIFKGMTIEEAPIVCQDDPATRAGRLALKFHTWMTPTGCLF